MFWCIGHQNTKGSFKILNLGFKKFQGVGYTSKHLKVWDASKKLLWRVGWHLTVNPLYLIIIINNIYTGHV